MELSVLGDLKTDLKNYMLYDSIYMFFQKRQNSGYSKKIDGC